MAIRFPPSQHTQGSTGPWSTFQLQIGSPPQLIEVLPATSKSSIWPVLPDYCSRITAVDNDDECAIFRGGLYIPANSHSWEEAPSGEQQYTELPFEPEEPLGYSGSSLLGMDVVGLGGPPDSAPALDSQALLAFADTIPWLSTGLLGLNPNSLFVEQAGRNFSSVLANLRETDQIPSRFWGYNAGAARYLYPPPFASLTLGGYDYVRAGDLKDALNVTMQLDNSRDLVVTISAISIGDGDVHIPGSTINAFVDSVVPDIWLPAEDCKIFEDAFGLVWNETEQMYLLDDNQVRNLYKDTEAKVNFKIADPADSTNSINISLAYPAFDLQARYPFAGIQDNSSVHYFPLKRANDSSQYYLGHTFLQEAYIAADYDRSIFYVSQANLPQGAQAYDTRTIYPPANVTRTVETPERGGLGTGAIAGIAVGSVIVVLIAMGLAAWFYCRPQWKKRRNSRYLARIEADNAGLPDSQLSPPGESKREMQEYYATRPLSPDSDYKQELDATTTARGSLTTRAEMESPSHSDMGSPRNSKIGPRRSSYGFPTSPAELESRSPRMMHSRTASGSSVEPMSPLSGGGRRNNELEPHEEERHELP